MVAFLLFTKLWVCFVFASSFRNTKIEVMREGESREHNIKWKGKTTLKNKKNEGVQKSRHRVQFKNSPFVVFEIEIRNVRFIKIITQ